jgi:membrane-bound serine protease (ClpP class)
MKQNQWFARTLLFLTLLLLFVAPVQAQSQEHGPLYLIEIDGVITSITVGYMERALRTAEASNATALIIELSSEGAVLRTIRPLAAQLAEATIPVVVYVTPENTASGSAGAFFLSAAHIAAMAPETSFGTPYPLAEVDNLLSAQTKELVLNNVEAQFRKWNEQHGRNTEWIDRAVREGVLFTNRQAIATNPPIINIVATDRDDLLTLLHGRMVQLANGQEVELETMGREPRGLDPSLWEQFLLFLADPTVAFLLLVMGFVALYAELAHPGVGLFAGISGVLIIAAFVGLLVLPIRWISFLGLLLAFGLIATDLFVPTHGGLTLTGLVLMIVSSLTLIDAAQAPNVFVALWAIFMVAIVVAAFAALAIWLILRLRDTPIATGREGLVGRMAEVRHRLDPDGMVFVDGALWRALCESGTAEVGEWVKIKEVHDLRLIVVPVDAHPAGIQEITD